MLLGGRRNENAVLKEERDYFCKRTTDLEAIILSGALEVVTRGQRLVDSMPAHANGTVAKNLEGLAAKIDQIPKLDEGTTPNDRKTILTRFKVNRASNKWTPEKGMKMALQSLETCLDYFENEQDLAQIHSNTHERENKVLVQTIDSLKEQLEQVTKERDEWKEQSESYPTEKAQLEDLTKQMEFFELERKRLMEENKQLQSNLAEKEAMFAEVPSKNQLEALQATIDDLEQNNQELKAAVDDLEREKLGLNSQLEGLENEMELQNKSSFEEGQTAEAEMIQLRSALMELETENALLVEQMDKQNDRIDELERVDDFKKFDNSFEGKAKNFKMDDLQARVHEYSEENIKLRDQCATLEAKVNSLESSRRSLEGEMIQLKVQLEQQKELQKELQKEQSKEVEEVPITPSVSGDIPLSLSATNSNLDESDAVYVTGDRRESRFSFKPRDLAKGFLSPRTGLSISQHDNMSMNEFIARIDELEDQHARVVAQNATQQMRISVLEDELERRAAEKISQDAQMEMLRNAVTRESEAKQADMELSPTASF